MKSREVGSAVSLFPFEFGFQNKHLEVVKLKMFAKGLNIYSPFKKYKDICFSTALFLTL